MGSRESDVEIVQAQHQHLDLLAPLFDQYRQFYKQSSDLARARAFLEERMERRESVIFLALADEAMSSRHLGPTGLGFMQLYPAFSSESMKRLWILNDLFVAPAGRRRGVAKKLMERACQLALETHAKGLVLETAIDNDPAQRLYESLGWKRDMEFYRYYLNAI